MSKKKGSSTGNRGRADGMDFSNWYPSDTNSYPSDTDSDTSESESDDDKVPSEAPVLGSSSTPAWPSIVPETQAEIGILANVTGNRGRQYLPHVPNNVLVNAATGQRRRFNAAILPRPLVIPTGINDPAAAVDGAASYQLPG